MGVGPKFYRVIPEHDRVQVLQFRGKPGDKTEMLSHLALVHIGLTEGERVSLP